MDTRIFFWVILALAALWIGYRIYEGFKSYALFGRGKRLVTCPENKEVVAVDTDGARVAFTAAVGTPELRLRNCSRWPEKADCGQECLAQVEIAPKECTVQKIVENWFDGKSCIYCSRQIGHLDWSNRQPALMDEKRNMVSWSDVPAEKLPQLLANCWPVCSNCYVSESFRKAFPSLVIERNHQVEQAAKEEVTGAMKG